jgi:hypothetical protein
MRVRRLDALGDMTFGRGQNNFWIDQPEGVAQMIMTRLRLNYGEWFADTSDGTPWNAQVLGVRTQGTRDAVVRSRVFGTSGVQSMTGYNSVFDPNTRDWAAAMNVQTLYGPAAVALIRLPGTLPPTAVVPITQARLLGIAAQPGGSTPVAMQRANLLQEGRVDITDFQILQVDAGRF